jgi:SET domain-containing protein
VFPSAARCNHSCAPNAHQSFDAHGCVTVDTVREVKKGEELTIPYVDTRLPRWGAVQVEFSLPIA